jgi:hypothetical protein
MMLIQLARHPHECRVEWNGVDITPTLTSIDVRAHLGTAITTIVLTVIDDVAIIGEPGRLEFKKGPR